MVAVDVTYVPSSGVRGPTGNMAPMPNAPVGVPATLTSPDEVSLRDLFLVVKRWWIVILLVALVAGIAVVVYLRSRPPVYLATATTVVSRAQVDVQTSSNLAVRPDLDVTFEAYQALATGQAVLSATAAALADPELDVEQLRSMLELQRLVGAPNQVSDLLVVNHLARSQDAQTSARLATAWAEASLSAVQAMVRENLGSLRSFGGETLAFAEAELGLAEQALRDYRVRAEVQTEPQRLDQLRRSLDAVGDQLVQVRLLLPARLAELESLRSRLAVDPQALVVLSDAPEAPLSVQGGVWSLEARVAALTAQETSLAAQHLALEDEIAVIGLRVVDHQMGLATLTRTFDAALAQVNALSTIGPATEYLSLLAGGRMRLSAAAAAPQQPEGRPVLVFGLLTVLAVALAGAVLVLLAEAVRAPDEADVAESAMVTSG